MSISLSKLVVTGQALTKTMIDTPLTEIETKLNVTGISADEIQSSAITTAKINDSAVTTAKINDLGVTTGKINDLAVTAGKLAADSVETAKILDANVTNAKLAGSITRTKLVTPVTEVTSAATTQALTSSGGDDEFTSFTDSITTVGSGKVLAYLELTGSGTSGAAVVVTSNSAALGLKRDSTQIARLGPLAVATHYPFLQAYDAPGIGTFSYSVFMDPNALGSTVTLQLCRLVLIELG